MQIAPKATCRECSSMMDAIRVEYCMGYCATCMSIRCAKCGGKLPVHRPELQNLPSGAKHFCITCWKTKCEELETVMGLRPTMMVVSPYPRFVEYLKKKKIVSEGVEVQASVNSNSIINRTVVCADLPMRLAVLAQSVLIVPLKLSIEDEFQKNPEKVTIERITKAAGKPRRYKITEVT